MTGRWEGVNARVGSSRHGRCSNHPPDRATPGKPLTSHIPPSITAGGGRGSGAGRGVQPSRTSALPAAPNPGRAEPNSPFRDTAGGSYQPTTHHAFEYRVVSCDKAAAVTSDEPDTTHAAENGAGGSGGPPALPVPQCWTRGIVPRVSTNDGTGRWSLTLIGVTQ